MALKVKYSSEKLIDLVHQNPELWDKKYPGNSNKKLRDEIWNSIADTFLAPEIDANACKMRWQSLRAGRTKGLHRAFRNAVTKPGQLKTQTRPHKNIALLSFLGDNQIPDWENVSRKYIRKGTTLMDDTQDSDEYVDDQHEQSTSTSSEPTHEISLPKTDDDNWELHDANLPEVKRNHLQHHQLEATLSKPKERHLFPQDEITEPDNSGVQEVGTSQQSDDSIDKRRVGEYELWCKSLACRLYKMKPETASLIMLKAQTLIHEAEFGELSK